MKKHSFVWFIVILYLIIFFLTGIGPVISKKLSKDEEKVARADGFTISSYKVKLDVKEDLKVDVEEDITVDWNESHHHGILKFTPEWLKYTGKNGKTIRRKSIVSNYRAIGDEYSLDVVKNKPRIKIGSAYSYVDLGEKDYVIAYTYDMGKDPFHGFDEFIFHAFGDYWGTEINNATLEITMPKSFDTSTIKFFADKYRQDELTDAMDVDIVGNTIYASLSKDKYYQKQLKEYCSKSYNNENDNCLSDNFEYTPFEKALTVDIELPNDYFVGGSYNYTNWSLLWLIVCFALTLITVITWYKYGKNYPKRAKTVEFYPPEGLSSAEIGYISGNKNIKKLTISLVVSLASKGYIKIDTVGKKKEIQITNLSVEPSKPKSISSLPKRKIDVQKLKEIDDTLSKEEITMMKFMFRKHDTKELNSNFDKFDAVKDSLLKNGYIQIIHDNEADILQMIENENKKHEDEFKEYYDKVDAYENYVKNLEPLNAYEKVVYDRLKSYGESFRLKDDTEFYKAFNDVNSLIKSGIYSKVNDTKADSKIFGAIARSIASVILPLVAFFVTEDLDPSLSSLYNLGFLCIPVNIFFSIFMGRYTEYGEEIRAKVAGFKDFLVHVEKDQLESLVNQNPSYFYNILPYTYVLGVSKKWINKFEDIYYPQMDMGSFDFSSDSSYSSFSSNVYYPAPSYSGGGGSSGCSSCGGGCSSCGGGCSSCGGGGSW